MCRILLYLFAVIALASCHHRQDFRQQLNMADTLMRTDADSAFRLLCGMESAATRMPESLRMEHLLLKCNAQNKVYIPFSSDSLGLKLVDYYDHKGNYNQRMLAHYMLGCAYRDMRDFPSALRCFNDAVAAADTSETDCNLYQMSIIYCQIGNIYIQYALPEEAVKAFDKCEYYSLLSGHPIGFYSSLVLKGKAYIFEGRFKEALELNDKAVKGLDSLGCHGQATSARFQCVEWLMRDGQMEKARQYLDDYEANSGYFLSNGDIEEGREDYYHIKGTYYLLSEKLDSAEYFFRKLMRDGKLMNDKYLAAWGLSQLYKERGVCDSVAKYAYMGDLLGDTLYNEKVAQATLQNQAMFDYSRYELVATQKEREAMKERWRLAVACMVGGIALAVMAAMIYAYAKKKKQLLLSSNALIKTDGRIEILEGICKDYLDNLHEKMQNIVSLERELDKEREAEKVLQNELEEVKSFTESKISEYEEKLKEFGKMRSQKQLCNQAAVKRMFMLGEKRLRRPKEEEWDEYIQAVEKEYPQMLKLKMDNKLEPLEYRVCVLVKLGMKVNEIIYLTDTTNSRISMMRSRLHKRLFGESGGAKDFDQKMAEL